MKNNSQISEKLRIIWIFLFLADGSLLLKTIFSGTDWILLYCCWISAPTLENNWVIRVQDLHQWSLCTVLGLCWVVKTGINKHSEWILLSNLISLSRKEGNWNDIWKTWSQERRKTEDWSSDSSESMHRCSYTNPVEAVLLLTWIPEANYTLYIGYNRIFSRRRLFVITVN
jgi:hypothetical protein